MGGTNTDQPIFRPKSHMGLMAIEGVLLLRSATGVLGVLAAHGPGAFGEAKALGLDGIEQGVI